MKKYLFETITTLKPADAGKWWIDYDYIKRYTIAANSPADALKEYAEKVNNDYYNIISKNAIKNSQPQYIDDENGDAIQTGYVITAKTCFDRGNYNGYVNKYIDLWITVSEIINPFTN